MYYKIAPIILNAGKNSSYSDVYVAQPDSLMENLAGKIFIIAEISAKKNEGKLIFDFLVDALDNYYYNDEKILLKDKIEGLKLENIFEAALSKVNKDLNDFLIEEKIKINSTATSVTIGVVYENKLYFSGFGKNRALLIYRRNDQYEVINVETNTTDLKEVREDQEFSGSKEANIFSSVISGEIPINSYFFFTSEALPEYLSNKEIISIITKLPPIVAAEQIKNTLEKINSFVPFLGVLIKNTIGLNISETKEEFEEILATHNSVVTIDHTEQKTELILAPAGVINLSKIIKRSQTIFRFLVSPKKINSKRSFKPEEDKSPASVPLDLGKIKSLNIARSDSFLVNEKIFFKKKPGEFFIKLGSIGQVIIQIFNPRNWLGLILKLRDWLKSLNPKNSLLFGGLILVMLVFIGSIIFSNFNQKKQSAQKAYDNIVAQIDEQENSIDQYLLYNNENAARAALINAQTLLSSLPQEKSVQKNIYSRLDSKLKEQSGKILKVVNVTQIEKTNDLSGLSLNSIALAAGSLYASDFKTIYSLTISSSFSTKFEISGAANLSKPHQDLLDKNFLYYLDTNQIVKFDIKKKTNNIIKINNLNSSDVISAYNIYRGNLYVILAGQNKIYRFAKDSKGFSLKTQRLTDSIDLSMARDLAIDSDGYIYILKTDGEILKIYDGKKQEYAAPALLPVMSSANKLFLGVKYIYLLDTSSKRLAIINKKDGHLLNQYLVSTLSNIQDFMVNEEAKLAYFLSNDSISRINLNQ